MENLANVHPGEILAEEFLKPMNISAYKLSRDIGIPQTRTSAIIKGARRITADTALRLSLYFGTTPKFWMGLQDDYDLEEALKSKQDELHKIKKNELRVSIGYPGLMIGMTIPDHRNDKELLEILEADKKLK